MQILNKKDKRKKFGILKEIPQVISQDYNSPALLKQGTKEWNSTCIGCVDPKCMQYSLDEITSNNFEDFPCDRTASVCPVSAIAWNNELEIPTINNKVCIGCGICARRCPLGAIYIKNGKVIVSYDEDSRTLLENEKVASEKQNKQISTVSNIKWVHHFTKESDNIMADIYSAIQEYDGRSNAQRLMVRNLIIALGYDCSISRQGDVYTRMDGVFSGEDAKGAVEIEFGSDTLEASRDILDDIAVMNSRFGLSVSDNTPLVVCLSLPNKRQGYFQVIKDIKKVLGIEVQTFSLGSLLLLCWNGKSIKLSNKDYYLDFDSLSLRDAIETAIGRKINISNGYIGILEPEK